MKIVNCTPHVVSLVLENGTTTLPTSGILPRCKVERRIIGSINNIPVTKSVFGQVENLPDREDGVIYICSMLVCQAESNRKDLYFPDDIVRDEKGNIIGCRALSQV